MNFFRRNKRIIITTAVVVGFLVINYFVMHAINRAEIDKPIVRPQAVVSEFKVNPYAGKEIVERIHLDPNRIYSVSVFWMDDKEIARFRSEGDKVYDIEGEIPDGKVNFINESTGTYGEEHYRNGKKHGSYQEHYSAGPIKREARYALGEVVQNKEFFIDGKLRMEENFEDALRFSESKNVGVGKIYFRSGTIMYEWNVTNRGPERYTKSYNIKGELVETKWFDISGKLIKLENLPSQIINEKEPSN